MRRENKGIFGSAKPPRKGIASLACGSLAMTLMLLSASWAALDIFDQPTARERKEKAAHREEEVRLLDYPSECLLKGNYQEAFGACQRLADYPPARKIKPKVLYLMGICSLKLGHYIEARGYFNDMIFTRTAADDLKADTRLGIADAYFFEGRFNDALEAYEQILKMYPNSQFAPLVYKRLSEILDKAGRTDEASFYFNKISAEFPFSFEARLPKDSIAARDSGNPLDKGEYHSVQVGCFNEKDNADKFCEKLINEGFDARILESENNEEPRYRVRVGKFRSRDEAGAIEAKLKNNGYSTKIYP